MPPVINLQVEFSVKNRLVLLASLPASGSIDTLRILRKLREDLSFSEEEHKAFNLVGDESGAFKWDMAAEKPKAIEIGAKAAEIIKTAIKAAKKKLAYSDDMLVAEKSIAKKLNEAIKKYDGMDENEKKSATIIIKIHSFEDVVIREALGKLNKIEALRVEHVEIWDLFMPGQSEDDKPEETREVVVS